MPETTPYSHQTRDLLAAQMAKVAINETKSITNNTHDQQLDGYDISGEFFD